MNAHGSSSRSGSPEQYHPPKLKMKLKESDKEKEERRWRKEQKRLRKESRKIYRANGLEGDEGQNEREGGRGRDHREGKGESGGSRGGTWRTPPRTGREESISPPRKRPRVRSAASLERELDRKEANHGGLPFSAQAMNLDHDDFDFSSVPPLSGDKEARKSAAAALEELNYRQKLFDMMEDDEGPTPLVSGRYTSPPPPPQTIPARWRNKDAYISSRWKESSAGVLRSDHQSEEEYAESIRRGMWKLKNKDEVERMERMAALKEEEETRTQKEKAEREKEEKKRIEVIQRESGKLAEKRRDAERKAYAAAWTTLKLMNEQESNLSKDIRFLDLPWPLYHSNIGGTATLHPDLLTREAIQAFLFSLPSTVPLTGSIDEEKLHRKRILREAILAYHPDRFLSRYLDKVREGDRKVVKEAVGRVSGVINDIMTEESTTAT